MRILVLAPQPFFQNRGTPIAVRMLVEDLQRAGHSVDLLVFHEGENIDLGGVRLYRTPAFAGISSIRPGFSLKKAICDGAMLLKAIRLCKRNSYDVIHAVEEAVFMAMILKKIFKIRYIYDVDSWMSEQLVEKHSILRFLQPLFFFFEKRAVRSADAAVVVCSALEEKVKKIDRGVPVLRLEDVSLLGDDPINYESLHSITDTREIVLYVGNLEKYQGVDLLLKSFSIVTASNSTASLVVIGGSPETLEKYRQMAEELAIDSRVFFIGPRPLENLGMYLRQADLLVSPRLEGDNTPMKIYSYMASGKPMVATRIRSHTQVLDETTAILAMPDSKSMADALLCGLQDKDSATEIGRKARIIADRHYSRSAYTRKLTTFYSELTHVWNLRI